MNICCLWGPTGFVPMCMFLFYFFGLLTAIISNCSDSLKNMGLFMGPCWRSCFFSMRMLYFYFQGDTTTAVMDEVKKKKTECGQLCGDRIFLGKFS
jgi:hypothetical protein